MPVLPLRTQQLINGSIVDHVEWVDDIELLHLEWLFGLFRLLFRLLLLCLLLGSLGMSLIISFDILLTFNFWCIVHRLLFILHAIALTTKNRSSFYPNMHSNSLNRFASLKFYEMPIRWNISSSNFLHTTTQHYTSTNHKSMSCCYCCCFGPSWRTCHPSPKWHSHL